MDETPPFDEALAAFMNFIRDQGFSTDLAWVFREDVTNCINENWIRAPIPPVNEEIARAYFEYGRGEGRGVTVSVWCRLGDQSACYVWVPEDDEAASYAMQTPLKLSVPSSPSIALPVVSSLRWRWLTLTNRWHRCTRFLKSLPSRDEAFRLTQRGSSNRPASGFL